MGEEITGKTDEKESTLLSLLNIKLHDGYLSLIPEEIKARNKWKPQKSKHNNPKKQTIKRSNLLPLLNTEERDNQKIRYHRSIPEEYKSRNNWRPSEQLTSNPKIPYFSDPKYTKKSLESRIRTNRGNRKAEPRFKLELGGKVKIGYQFETWRVRRRSGRIRRFSNRRYKPLFRWKKNNARDSRRYTRTIDALFNQNYGENNDYLK